MSALTSPSLMSPPTAPPYGLDAICRKVDEAAPDSRHDEVPHSPTGRTMDVISSASSVHHLQQNGGGRDDEGSVTSGDKQDDFSTEERANYENIMAQDYDEEIMSDSDMDDENEHYSESVTVSEDNASLDVTMTTTTMASSGISLASLGQPQPKRNKRKNFKPRNILYADDEVENSGQVEVEEDCDSDGGSEDRSHRPLDLSDNSATSAPSDRSKRRRKPTAAPQRRVNQFVPSSDDAISTAATPIDLSFARGDNESCADDNSDSDSEPSGENGSHQNTHHQKHSRNHHHHHHHHHQRHQHQHQTIYPQSGSGDNALLSNDRLYEQQNDGNGQESSSSSSNHRTQHSPPGGKMRFSPSLRGGSESAVYPGSGGPSDHVGYHPDASAMKEYAENTMKELLSIYGLSGSDMAETITRNVPMANFSSGKILETLSTKHQPSPYYPLSLSVRPPPSPPSQPPTPPRTPLSPPHKSGSSPGPGSSPRHHHGGYHSHSQHGEQATSVYESIRHKMADSMAKLTGMPPNSIMGNPRVMLPQNMATILTLAALQDQQKGNQQHASSSGHQGGSTPPNMDPNKTGMMSGHRMSPLSPGRDVANNGKNSAPIDYSRYVKRFGSALECGSTYCKDLNYREHFHCLDCNSRVFVKKEEMIRHFKWHKKRDESLQHGFMRYSPMDDCSDRYRGCSHNRKQTHYHCIKEGCDKVYISTSDVQMHANYHRKDSAIIQEGFQRFRATEECGAAYCSFFGQRTTHFHCRRDNCKYTFKNKADMEKHKTYHIKDEQLSRDGFKKFMKHETCPFESCRFSRVCNHIHCIRSGCNYVLHSSGQLFSHKRKHERQDSEMAYRKFKLAQSMMKSFGDPQLSPNMMQAFGDQLSQHSESSMGAVQTPVIQHGSSVEHRDNGDNSNDGGRLSPLAVQPPAAASTTAFPAKYAHLLSGVEGIPSSVPPPGYLLPPIDPPSMGAMDLSSELPVNPTPWANEDFWQKYLARFGANDKCVGGGQCELIFKEHFHCMAEGCEMTFRSMDGVREHARNHEQQEQVSDAFYVTENGQDGSSCQCEEDCPYQGKEKHYHCTWDNCREIILPSDKPFRRLDHYKMHEYSRKLSLTKDPLTMTHLATSIDGMFRRKRGRPPKNRVIEVWNDYFPMAPGSTMDSPQAIFTSFKLPKPSASSAAPGSIFGSQPLLSSQPGERSTSPSSPDDRSKSSTPHRLDPLQEGFFSFPETAQCPDEMCPYNSKSQHYHCSQPRCFYVTDREDILIMHSKDFHDNIDIMEGFLFFDRMVDCRLPDCHSNKVNRHFHCIRPGCGYSFVRYSTMAVHEQKHQSEVNGESVGETSNSARSNCESPTAAQNLKRLQEPESPVHIKLEPTAEATSHASSPHPTSPVLLRAPPLIQASSPESSITKTTDGIKQEPSLELPQHSLTRLLQQPHDSSPRPDWMSLERHVRYGPEQSCSRPFCKLKRKEHYHCNACNQAFSELEKLRPHIAKHSSGALSPSVVKREPEDNNNEESDDSNNAIGVPHPFDQPSPSSDHPQMPPHGALHPPVFPPHSSAAAASFNAAMAAAAAAGQQFALITSQGIPFIQPGLPAIYTSPAGLMFAAPPGLHPHHPPLSSNGLLDHHLLGDSDPSPLLGLSGLNKRSLSPHLPPTLDMSPEAKKARVQNSMRILKDEPVPEGYIRFRFNEDCKYPHCGYREHQTHFHCMRQDCGYSFCDKTRFVQHTARHERLDMLMGGDFQQFRANVSCGRQECLYTSTLGAMQNKASHFHCLKCDFVCTDTNKVVAHRRQHQKLDSIMAAGFEKFTPSQPCNMEACAHSGKQTHYHCLSCQYAVLGLSQMSAHKYRHME